MSENFDAVGFMRRRREEIDREDEGLSWEDKAKKTRELLAANPIWERLVGPAKERTSLLGWQSQDMGTPNVDTDDR